MRVTETDLKDKVIIAASELRAEGREVNGWALRTRVGELLGKEGGSGTPKKLLKIWQDHIDNVGKSPAAPAPDEVLPLNVLVHIDRSNSVISDFVKTELAKVAAVTAKSIKSSQPTTPDLATALARIEELEKALKFEEFRYAKAEDQIQSLFDDLMSKDEEIRELKAHPPSDDGIDIDEAVAAAAKPKE